MTPFDASDVKTDLQNRHLSPPALADAARPAYSRALSKRDVVALVVLAASLLVVGFGCAVTYGLLREYADVCGETAPLKQVWLSGAGFGPVVAVVAVALAVLVARIARPVATVTWCPASATARTALNTASDSSPS